METEALKEKIKSLEKDLAEVNSRCTEWADENDKMNKVCEEHDKTIKLIIKQRDEAMDYYESAHLLALRVIDQRDDISDALVNLLKVIPKHVRCADLHHPHKDRHAYDEDCPVIKKYQEAVKKAEEALTKIAGSKTSL
jgi:septal ring factor EnvC (AmiA/AmiB activator)